MGENITEIKQISDSESSHETIRSNNNTNDNSKQRNIPAGNNSLLKPEEVSKDKATFTREAQNHSENENSKNGAKYCRDFRNGLMTSVNKACEENEKQKDPENKETIRDGEFNEENPSASGKPMSKIEAMPKSGGEQKEASSKPAEKTSQESQQQMQQMQQMMQMMQQMMQMMQQMMQMMQQINEMQRGNHGGNNGSDPINYGNNNGSYNNNSNYNNNNRKYNNNNNNDNNRYDNNNNVPPIDGGKAPPRPDGYSGIMRTFGPPGGNQVTTKMPAGPGGKMINVTCNKKIADNMKAAFEEIKSRGLSNNIHSFDGCFNNRNKRGGSSKSVHAWGIAFDVNAGENPMGRSSQTSSQKQIAEIFKKYGFYQLPNDPMHFQYATGY